MGLRGTDGHPRHDQRTGAKGGLVLAAMDRRISSDDCGEAEVAKTDDSFGSRRSGFDSRRRPPRKLATSDGSTYGGGSPDQSSSERDGEDRGRNHPKEAFDESGAVEAERGYCDFVTSGFPGC